MKNIIFLGGEDVSARIELSKKLMAKDCNISIIGSEEKEKFQKNGIKYYRYQLNRELNVFDDVKTVLQLRKILKEQKNKTVVHAFDTKPTMFLPIASFGLKHIKVVRTITGMGRIFTEKSFKNSVLTTVYNTIQKIISKRVDFTIFQNDDDCKYFINNHLIKKDKSSVIKSSGIDLEKYSTTIDKNKVESLKKELDIDTRKPTFILVSRMVKQKGISNFLEAAKLCKENGYDYNFLLVGQIDSNKDSLTKEEILEYKQYVKYLGKRSDVKELLSLSDVFVLPTYYREGVPRVLLEASAMSLALIATDMPGCRDVIIDDFNGKLVNIKDSQDLFLKMIDVVDSKEKLEDYSRNSKIFVKQFDLNLIVERYYDVYKQVLEG
jgi:glycosyltransferase involved in cell wall biosynthesis